MRLAALTAVLGIAGMVSACTDAQFAAYPPDGSPAFQTGYSDGCRSGFSDGYRDGYSQSYTKDVARYDGEGDYREGWDEGYKLCYDEQYRTPKMVPDGPVM